MDNAVPPATRQVFHTFKKLLEPKTEIETAGEQETLVAGLSGDPRWEAYKAEVGRMIEALLKLEGAIDPSDDVETVGFRFLAARVAVAKLKEAVQIPDIYARTIRAGQTK